MMPDEGIVTERGLAAKTFLRSVMDEVNGGYPASGLTIERVLPREVMARDPLHIRQGGWHDLQRAEFALRPYGPVVATAFHHDQGGQEDGWYEVHSSSSPAMRW
jgi:hypothetical protein